MARVIWDVLETFGAGGDGFAGRDPETAALAQAYDAPRHAYFIAELDGHVCGGAGVAPLAGGDTTTAELRKMYLQPSARGRGIGRRLLDQCINQATSMGYTRIYLETLESMEAARRLYVASGFQPLDQPLGQTGHHGCDRWFVRPLNAG